MHLKKMFALIIVMGVMFVSVPEIFAGEIDILVDKLVEKGILTRGEANEVLSETREEVKKQAASVDDSGVPKWVKKIKVGGDFRLRYESRKRKGSKTANRGRIRYRLGIEADIVDQVKVGAGLASGSDGSTSSRSTNQDLQDAFSTKPFNLDYAYAEYKPADWVSMIGGKFKKKKYLWEPSDLLWDTDINPEGGSVILKTSLTDWAKVSFGTGVWILDEASGDTSDPYLFYVQPMVTFTNKDLKADAKLAFTYYDFENVKGTTLDDTEGTNTLDSGGGLEHKFMPWALGGELGFAKPFDLPIPRIALFAEYVNNTDPSDENNGWLMGLKLGDKKVNDTNKWQLKYVFAQLQKDAFPDAFPDADRYEGETDVRSHEGIAQLGLNKNIMVEFDYYHSRKIHVPKDPENVFQASANFKF
jgi:hypothetical protein